MRSVVVVALLGVMAVLDGSARPASALDLDPRSSFMRIYGEAHPIESYLKFCRRLPEECRQDDRGSTRVEMTAERWSELDEINRYVNHFVRPTPQWELYGTRDYWAYPDDQRRGDCNSYVLLKRKLLATAGWPKGSLLITVVLLRNGEGHAVLTARTSAGDLLLDNLSKEVQPWYDAPYDFVMRQSSVDPNVWVALSPRYVTAYAFTHP
jgi:predicted transglutaminase-like cysteine proteinase